MAEILFDKNFPEIARERSETILNEFSWLLPAWLQRLNVSYVGDDKESSAYITVEKDYRFACLRICGHWLSEDAKLQREQLVHELIHIHFSPLKNCAVGVIEILCGGEDDKAFKIAKDELASKNEMATTDLAFAIANKFKG
jgi:hypothetical protein